MIFKDLKIYSDFKKEITAKVCYIYKVDKDGDTISMVYYYRFENNKYVAYNARASWFAIQLIKNEYVAYCGKIVDGILTNVAKVLALVKENKPYLTTMADDDDANNLTSLADYYE